jgi:alpha-beta hydrolase superfamily lysophospholipase
MSPVGLGRFCSLRSWLSQWSLDDSRADAVRCLARVKLPVLVVGNGADDICTPSHTHRIYEAVRHPGKRLVEIPGATHYYFGQKAQLEAAVAAVDTWLREQQLRDH